ncbi:DNA-directed RNA polymerase III subunit RPC3 [Lutzomyia longipalpis]|uniref:DNA-directed RNA polymerase III subunit RPC3 n=1 Tax=Lutzomyia longipalpis TaxID=7200 RepID=UPI0024839AA3|nr:DNA-directed RNA polymerase III subunit RPC3 [Lutzomyia longipalpis]XP_055676837.1 DNA-directed RNA polymerase III subunit RPC3 [Lutzomyia longipalpis]
MSIQLGNLCSVILEQHFGANVQKIGQELYTGGKTLRGLMKTTMLSKNEVSQALSVLLKFRLATYEMSANKAYAEYSLSSDQILQILRYPRYIYYMQSKYGHTAALLVEELLRAGCETASYLISKSVQNSESKEKNTVVEHRDKFFELIQGNFFIRAIVGEKAEELAEAVSNNASLLFQRPEIDVQELVALQEGKNLPSTKDAGIYWHVNYEKFHQHFRDAILCQAIERRVNSNASECVRYLLQSMYLRTDPWKSSSNPIPFGEIRSFCEKQSNNLELIRYLEQYIAVIVDDPLMMLSKYSDAGGGQYVMQMKKVFEQLAWVCIENTIMEKFGAKAARIFRVVRMKKYIEQEDIQKEAMIPSKEAKQLTYKLLEEHFLQIHTIRKAGSSGTGPAKCFILFYVNQTQIVMLLMETCYKALFNGITRSNYDSSVNRRLIDKSQRLESVVEAMKERGESEEYIMDILETLTPPEREILEKVKIRIKNLYSAEIGLDETLFLFQMYQFYQAEKP